MREPSAGRAGGGDSGPGGEGPLAGRLGAAESRRGPTEGRRGVLIAGYYGYGNLGDEAILESLLGDLTALLPHHAFRVLTAGSACARRARVEFLPRLQPRAILEAMRRSQLLVLGGGSLIQDSTSLRSLLYYLGLIWLAKRFGLKAAIYGGGIGPVTTPRGRALARAVLPQVDLLALRDRRSMEEALSLGVAGERLVLTADPAFAAASSCAAVPPGVGGGVGDRVQRGVAGDEAADRALDASGVPAGARGRLLGISLRPPMAPADIAAMAEAADSLAAGRHGLFPLFLPFHPEYDTDTLVAVGRAMRSPSAVLQGVADPGTLRSVVGRLRVAVAMRLHAAIFAVGAGVPCVALSYDPKVDALVEDVPALAHARYPGIAGPEVAAAVERLVLARDELRPELLASAQRLAQRARVNAAAVSSLVLRGGYPGHGQDGLEV